MFKARLRELREARGYKSQQEFANAFCVAQSTVGGWEAGKREPNYETTIRLARFFGVTVGYLVGAEGCDGSFLKFCGESSGKLGNRSRNSLPIEQLREIVDAVEIFDFEGNRIRVATHDGQPWIVFADACKALGYKNPRNQSKYIKDDEKCRIDICLKNTLAICVNQRGLLRFTLFSNKKEATAFREWADEKIFGRDVMK